MPYGYLSEAICGQIKAGIFVGRQLKKTMQNFLSYLQRKRKQLGIAFLKTSRKHPLQVEVVRGFLGKHKAENYDELVQTLVRKYCEMGCRISFKVHILDIQLYKFKENMDAFSGEQV